MNSEILFGLHPIFSQKAYENWTDLEREIGKIVETKEKGDVFEQFCYFYLFYHKDLYQIEEIWSDKIHGREIPSEIREKYKLEKKDYGVDGVSRLINNRIEGWQCKFRSDQSSPTVAELSTFWTESEYCDSKRTIANTPRLPAVSKKKINHEQTLLDKFLELRGDFFISLFETAKNSKIVIKSHKFSPRPHQQNMIEDVVAGLQNHNRGKLIAACGTGKTLAALWITENSLVKADRVLVLAPSISLVGQTVREWVKHRNMDFQYLCVCSDKSILNEIEEAGEESDIAVDDLDFPVTTTPQEVVSWLQKNEGKRQYIFSTYHSIPVIESALQIVKGTNFDLTIFDEAHRTVGRGDQFFARALTDSNIPSLKRLFMTATERMVNPIVKSYAKNSGTEVFSMDDESTYGPVLHDFNFGKAIEAGIIADYEIVLAVVSGQQELELIEKRAYVIIEDESSDKITLSSDLLFKAGFLLKTLGSGESKKVITFHSSRKNAIIFNRALEALNEKSSSADKNLLFTYVLGDQNSGERSLRISKFEIAPIGVLGNVQVLTEGVDIPIVDSVYFVDPKSSLIDIVQAIGRALRKLEGSKKTAKIIVPVIIPDEVDSLEDIPWEESFSTFHAVVQSMRDQDYALREEIDSLNQYAITQGGRGTRLALTGSKNGKIKLDSKSIKLPTGISLDSFLEKITFRIASANANASGEKIGFSNLGKGERKSVYKPILGFLGDYNPDTYYSSLIQPTLLKFTDKNDVKNRSDLTINHNNLSHAQRLGALKEIRPDTFVLTHIGTALFEKRISFDDTFKNQMLLFQHAGIFSYRVVLEMLLTLKQLDHIEFLFGPYIIQDPQNIETEIARAIERVQFIRANFPNIALTNLSNRKAVTEELNSISPTNIPHNDIWGDRSTPKNKFRYLANSLVLFDFFEPRKEGYREPIKVSQDGTKFIINVLQKSNPDNAPMEDFFGSWNWLG